MGNMASSLRIPAKGWVDTAALLEQARVCESNGALRDAESVYGALIVAAVRQDDQATLAEAFRRLAVLAHQAGDSSRARSALHQSYAVAISLGDHRLTAETLNTLGGLELETRNLTAAEAALTEAAKFASDHPSVLARVSQNLGIVANIRGDHASAEEHYRRSLVAYEALGDAHGSAIAQHNLGMLAADRGDYMQAVAQYEACEDLTAASGDSHLGALSLVNRAEALLALGRPAAARNAIETAERTLEALGAHFDASDVQRVLALCDQADGALHQAEARLLRARELAQMTDARLTEAEVGRDLGRVYVETGRVDQARRALRDAAQTFAELGATADADATRRELAALGGQPS
jgi:tetratricopeptide (TPR) repeat protein